MTKRIFADFPTERPNTPLLDSIAAPSDMDDLNDAELLILADELREFLLYTVSQTGGHFGAGLGVIELTIALHKVFNTPYDRIVWDVGHQAYPHKILTGRREAMATLRQKEGIAGFPKRDESHYDAFGVGHSSTSISAALGMAVAAQLNNEDRRAIAVIGDGAMTAGMAFEAMYHAVHTDANLLVILNDNQMSISANEGGLASYFAKIWASKLYTTMREGGKKVLSRIPPAFELIRRTEEHMKGIVSPGMIFEEIGFNYIGPIDGHDLPALTNTLSNISKLKGPQLLHVLTQKGHGFTPAVNDPVGYHAITKLASKSERQEPSKKTAPKYQDVFGQWLCDMATTTPQLVGITPAMCEGSGMLEFSKRFPDRYHDVAIAEQHAVTFAAGLSCESVKPVVAIYSTFLQRAYDQLIHDVALQNLDVLFAIDRAGLVGEDGPSHMGGFDISFLRCIPNMVVMTPSDENETRLLLSTGFHHSGPASVRYPRGQGTGVEIDPQLQTVEIGKAIKRRNGEDIAILCFGTLLKAAKPVAEQLNATLIDMRFVKPIDEQCVLALANSHKLIVTIEDNVVAGGAGSAVNELILQKAEQMPSILNLGLPDEFVCHGKQEELYSLCQLDSAGIQSRIEQRWQSLQTRV